MTPSPTRFFLVVCAPSAGVWVSAAALIAYGGYVLRLEPNASAPVLAITLFLQAFQASTGFRGRLRLGHFDPVLVSEPHRWRIGVAHWLVSIGPGAVVWTFLGLLQLIANPHAVPLAFHATVVVLFAYVSTMAWAISVVGGRWTGALTWLLTLIVLNVTNSLAWFRMSFVPAPHAVIDAARSLASVLVMPMLLAIDPATVSAVMLALVSLATALALLCGVVVVAGLDGVLMES